MASNLRETVFHIEKLRNIVGVGNCSAYQICTSPGQSLGRIGRVADDSVRHAANADSYEAVGRISGTAESAAPWFVRMLNALKP